MTESLPSYGLLVFTGPIDAYYASKGLPKLEYRSLLFEKEYHEPESGLYQEALQVRGVWAQGGQGVEGSKRWRCGCTMDVEWECCVHCGKPRFDWLGKQGGCQHGR